MKKGTLSIIAGLLLIAAALSLTAYNLWDDRRAGAEAQRILTELLPQIEEDPVPKEGRMRYQYMQSGEEAGSGTEEVAPRIRSNIRTTSSIPIWICPSRRSTGGAI